MRNVVIVILLAMLVWFGTAIIRLERYHYASTLGICGRKANPTWLAQQDCLATIETRTGPVWHLAYGLRLV